MFLETSIMIKLSHADKINRNKYLNRRSKSSVYLYDPIKSCQTFVKRENVLSPSKEDSSYMEFCSCCISFARYAI